MHCGAVDTANPELLVRFAGSICVAQGVQGGSRAEIAAEAAQEAAVALLRRPIGDIEAPVSYMYAVVQREVVRASKRWLPRKRQSVEALNDLASPGPSASVEVPDLEAIEAACGEVAFGYLQTEMEMPEADVAAKAAHLGVTPASYRVGLCRARARARELGESA